MMDTEMPEKKILMGHSLLGVLEVQKACSTIFASIPCN